MGANLIEEVSGFIEDDGYKVIEPLVNDYGRTVKLVIEKDGVQKLMPLLECFYDRDSEGNYTNVEVFDIRLSLWYIKKHFPEKSEKEIASLVSETDKMLTEEGLLRNGNLMRTAV